MVPTQPAAEALLGNPSFKALGLNTAEVLRAAASNNNGEVHFKELIPIADYKKGTISGIIRDDSIYHSDRRVDTEKFLMQYIDVKKDKTEENRIQGAISNSISKNAAKLLRKILQDNGVLCVRLEHDANADVEPMHVGSSLT